MSKMQEAFKYYLLVAIVGLSAATVSISFNLLYLPVSGKATNVLSFSKFIVEGSASPRF